MTSNSIKKDQHILIVGGAGYIGSHTTMALQKKNRECLVLDDLSTGHRDAVFDVTLFEGNISDTRVLDDIFTTYNVDSVIHFAANAYVGESNENPIKYYANNVANTITLIKTMLKHGVKKLVFSSTCATYGEPQYVPIDERHPQNPINPYGRTKLMVEQVIKDCSVHGLSAVILRYFNAAGAVAPLRERHEPETHIIPLVIRATQPGKQVSVFGDDYETKDGTCIRDYIHVADLAEAHILSLDYLAKKQGTYVFNLSNGAGFSVKEIIDCAEKVTAQKVNYQIQERRAGDPSVLIGDSRKAQDALGWEPKITDLEEIIASAL